MLKTTQKWEIGDALKLLPSISDNSIDLILTDLPYGTTHCAWDSIIPLKPLWIQYKRIIKNKGIIALTAQTPFDKVLGCSNLEMLRYEWIWQKTNPTGFLNAYRMPLKAHENILIFYEKLPTYNPQTTIGKSYTYKKNSVMSDNYADEFSVTDLKKNDGTRMPISVQVFSKDSNKIHPTQKPLALFEYLIRTYTNPGDTVHDSCVGAGTTLEACINLNRNCTCFDLSNEWEWNYHKIMDKKKNLWQLSDIFGKDLL